MRNWKTTLAGILAILGVAVKIASTGQGDASDLAAFLAGVGLLMAKDHNVTGGTVQQ